MTAFSDNFPFDPPAETHAAAPEPEPVVHGTPGSFDAQFPFDPNETAKAPATIEADAEANAIEREAQEAAVGVAEARSSSIFGEGFPFDAPRVFDDVPAPAPAAVEAAPAPTPAAPSPDVSIFTDEDALAAARAIPAAAPEPLTFPDRRRSPRQTMLAKAMLRPDAGGPARAVELRNLSLLGVRFRCGESIRVGERFHIKLEVGPLKWATRLRVINCVKDETGAAHYIGCAFIGNELTRTYPVAA
jgi:hypothetical protein